MSVVQAHTHIHTHTQTHTHTHTQRANQQLFEKANYKQLTQDPTIQHNRIATQTIENEKLLPNKKLQIV